LDKLSRPEERNSSSQNAAAESIETTSCFTKNAVKKEKKKFDYV